MCLKLNFSIIFLFLSNIPYLSPSSVFGGVCKCEGLLILPDTECRENTTCPYLFYASWITGYGLDFLAWCIIHKYPCWFHTHFSLDNQLWIHLCFIMKSLMFWKYFHRFIIIFRLMGQVVDVCEFCLFLFIRYMVELCIDTDLQWFILMKGYPTLVRSFLPYILIICRCWLDVDYAQIQISFE